jgi:molecular chaperone HtpG
MRLQAEGTFEYQALLFLPAKAPFDLFMRERKRGVQLYVKRVFIMDDCEALMPEYLRFVKGVVDAQDLSLNVSREILQQDRQIERIRRRLVKKVLQTIKGLPEEKYLTFWQEFGRAIKEGLLDDTDNREAILELSSFDSTHSSESQTRLADYVERMKEGQEHIYFLTGETRQAVEHSPHLEAFQDKGFEVLILTDPIDEMWVDAVDGFGGKKFQSIAKGQVDLDESKDPEQEKEFSALLEWLKSTLAEQVKDVRLSSRLTSSPACIVGDSYDMTPTLEKMYRAMGQEMPSIKRILELNPKHDLVAGLREAHAAAGEDKSDLAETAELLYGMALLAEGGDLADPARFTKLLATRLAKTL